MKKLLYLLPLLLGIIACGAQVQSTPNVTDMVNATLTAVAQNNPQGIIPQTTSVPILVELQPTATQSQPLPSDPPEPAIQSQPLSSNSFVPSGSINYFWSKEIPEGYSLNRELSYANSNGFFLSFIDPSVGAISVLGGSEVARNCDNAPGEPVVVRGVTGCFLTGTGGGFTVVWKENGNYYSTSVSGTLRDMAPYVAEHLESIDLSTFLMRLSSSIGNIAYFWPHTLPKGFILSREISYANSNGFALTFIDPSVGSISVLGGAEVTQNCNNSGEPVTVRGQRGCFLPSTGGGFTVVWQENGTYYSVGVMGTFKDLALATAEQLESIDLSTFLARLAP